MLARRYILVLASIRRFTSQTPYRNPLKLGLDTLAYLNLEPQILGLSTISLPSWTTILDPGVGTHLRPRLFCMNLTAKPLNQNCAHGPLDPKPYFLLGFKRVGLAFGV